MKLKINKENFKGITVKCSSVKEKQHFINFLFNIGFPNNLQILKENGCWDCDCCLNIALRDRKIFTFSYDYISELNDPIKNNKNNKYIDFKNVDFGKFKIKQSKWKNAWKGL